jgi:dihydrofolate reductase
MSPKADLRRELSDSREGPEDRSMRKLVLQMQSSLDGFVGGPKGELDWIFQDFDEETAKWEVETLWQAGAHLMGSVTYRDMAAHWPTSKEPYAPPMNQIPKIVFSRSLEKAEWGETRIVTGDLEKEIAQLKQQPGGELLAHGGARFAQSLTRSGLVDEYRFIFHPVVLGKGLRPFPDVQAPRRLKLVAGIRFKSGAVVMILQN